MQKVTLTVGIPAHNEENNIKRLISGLMNQKSEYFILEKIIVAADGCTDKTAQSAKSISDERITVIDDGQRLGKIKRLNQMMQMSSTDIFCQIDGDVLPVDDNTIDNLIKPFVDQSLTDVVYGEMLPLAPRTFVERLAYFGNAVWEDGKTILGSAANGYRCMGQNTAYSRKFYTSFGFPPDVYTVEEFYIYYYAVLHGFNIVFTPSARFQFRLVSNFADYQKQMKRYLNNPVNIRKYFKEEEIRPFETMTSGVKLKALAHQSIKFPPHIVISYIMLQIYTKFFSLFYKSPLLWDVSHSSKEVN